MKFAEIIRNANLDIRQYPNSSTIEIYLYDGKDRITQEESVHYVEPLFKHNDGSLKNFINFLIGFEKEDITSINVKVDVNSVVLFYKNPRAIIFPRKPSMNSLDYMD